VSASTFRARFPPTVPSPTPATNPFPLPTVSDIPDQTDFFCLFFLFRSTSPRGGQAGAVPYVEFQLPAIESPS
jgi:hypothetical protein